MKSSFKDFFYFNPKERKGIIILLVLIVLVIIVKQNLHYFVDKPQWPTDKIKDYFSKMEVDTISKLPTNISNYTLKENPPFSFDPNTTKLNDWLELGLSEKQAKTILNYLDKGGRFYQKSDLKKVYSVSNSFYNFVEDSISLPTIYEKKEDSKSVYESQGAHYNKNRGYALKRSKRTIFLNNSDTLDWQSLYGIGPVYAKRIVKYRSSLGGFVSKDQLFEVWGIQDSIIKTIIKQVKLDTVQLNTLNINTMSAKELKSHPYINWNTANAIFNYRGAHGEYHFIEDIKKIHIVDDSLFNKIKPYLIK